ncbi:MAG: serine--tRNA ligase [Candidatus Bathyarchaeota archaeon]|nr:MAG: serine--tRNA ligase [Candidatus Bathyarchaeota archaeon]
MLELRFVRENPEIIKNNLRRRGSLEKIQWVDQLIVYDEEWRKKLTEANGLRRQRNQITSNIAKLKAEGKDVSTIIKEAESLSQKIKKIEQEVGHYAQLVHTVRMQIPNIIHESVPLGKGEEDNVEVRRWGQKPSFRFPPRDHIELSLSLKLVDLERAAKVAGARFYYLKNEMVSLNYAVIQYALSFIQKRGFTLIQPPYTIKRQSIEGAIALTDFEDMIYKIEGVDLYLIATAEHALVALHMDEILDGGQLPLKYSGISPCFRKEAGAHGRDTKGIFRVHQFEKVEQFIFCKPEDSWNEHEALITNAEAFFQSLKIPYRVMSVCTGDLGTVAAKKYDLEAWLPGQNKYREVVSCSNCTSYQAVRSRIRYRNRPNDPTTHVHTLNSTLAATERVLIAILENYQQKDGSVMIPEVLIPYMEGKKIIEAPKKN